MKRIICAVLCMVLMYATATAGCICTSPNLKNYGQNTDWTTKPIPTTAEPTTEPKPSKTVNVEKIDNYQDFRLTAVESDYENSVYVITGSIIMTEKSQKYDPDTYKCGGWLYNKSVPGASNSEILYKRFGEGSVDREDLLDVSSDLETKRFTVYLRKEIPSGYYRLLIEHSFEGGGYDNVIHFSVKEKDEKIAMLRDPASKTVTVDSIATADHYYEYHAEDLYANTILKFNGVGLTLDKNNGMYMIKMKKSAEMTIGYYAVSKNDLSQYVDKTVNCTVVVRDNRIGDLSHYWEITSVSGVTNAPATQAATASRSSAPGESSAGSDGE